jgi:hypothetical protein
VIPPYRVLEIAHEDASRAYRDLTPYTIRLVLQADGWHVDYELPSSQTKGGGPRYVIDPTTGAILSKRYTQ